MRFSRIFLSLIALLSVGIVAVSVLGISDHVSITNPFREKPSVNSLSGIEGTDGPVLVVKIDDTTFARPQTGLELADIVYIEQVEGGLTRLAAVFSREIPPLIGPVRSARITDIDLLSHYGYVAFAYSGAQSRLRPVLAAANVKDIGAERLGADVYFNDPNRTTPYAMMLRAQEVMASLKNSRIPIAQSRSMGWNFGEAPKSGTAISHVRMNWPAASYDADWSDDSGRWLLSNNGIKNFSTSGVQLSASTLVIQKVLVTPSEYRDKVGGVTPLSQVIGSGNGYILRDGQYFPARWIRESADSGTRWIDSAGDEILFSPGPVWIALTDREPTFSVTNPVQR